MKKHKAAGIVPYIVEDDPYHPKVLLIKSDLGWEFPKGRVESNETTLTAAIRETKEETGLSDLKIHHRFRHISKYNITKNFSTGEKLEAPEPKQVTYFLAQSANKNVTLSYEHEEYGWFNFIEAREKLKNTKKYKVLNSVIQFFIDKKYL